MNKRKEYIDRDMGELSKAKNDLRRAMSAAGILLDRGQIHAAILILNTEITKVKKNLIVK
jgi:hypothetical protein